MKTYQQINKEIIDSWIEDGWEWGNPISHNEYLNAKKGQWDVLLTPTVFVPHEWLGNVKGKKTVRFGIGRRTANADIQCAGRRMYGTR